MKQAIYIWTTFFALAMVSCDRIKNKKPAIPNKTEETPKDKSNYLVGKTAIRLTVLKLDNQNPGFEYKTDTLMNRKLIDLTKVNVDVLFSHRNFQIPYYMPTNGIYKDSVKNMECNWKIYPSTVKCYEYDNKSRVIKMQVEGSGTTGSHTFVYDDSDKIIEMQSHGDKYKMTYDQYGDLTKMTVDGGILQKQLTFIYEQK